MIARAVNPNSEFQRLLKAVVSFDHGAHDRGVVQIIFLEGSGRVLTGCTTLMEPTLNLPMGGPGNFEEEVRPWLRRLMDDALDPAHVVLKVPGLLGVMWQISPHPSQWQVGLTNQQAEAAFNRPNTGPPDQGAPPRLIQIHDP